MIIKYLLNNFIFEIFRIIFILINFENIDKGETIISLTINAINLINVINIRIAIMIQ